MNSHFESDASLLQELQNGLKKKQFAGPALLIVDDGQKLYFATHGGPDNLAADLKASDLLRDLAAIAGGIRRNPHNKPSFSAFHV